MKIATAKQAVYVRLVGLMAGVVGLCGDAGGGARVELVGPNGLATRWEVDGLGRVARELRADGNESCHYLRQCAAECPPATAMVRIVESFLGDSRMAPPSLTYLDDAGRTLRTQSWGFDGQAVVADRRYGAMGRQYYKVSIRHEVAFYDAI